MDKVSILIPCRNEKYRNIERTLESVENNVTGEHEIIIGYDGESEDGYIDIGTNLKVIYFPSTVGIKTNINSMASMATGKYLFKLDAHTSVGKGFDEILKKDMQDDWIVMPRFYVLDEKTWEWQDDRFYDYFHLCCPFTDPKGFRFKAGGHWPQLTKERLDIKIDETPQIHGSAWFMTRDRFFELGGFPNIDPFGHAQEPIWLAMKNWMAGGKVMVNKNTWYAHMHQDKHGYHIPHAQNELSYHIAANFFVGDKWSDLWPKKIMSFEQFVDKWMPMPGWSEDWKEQLHKWQEQNK